MPVGVQLSSGSDMRAMAVLQCSNLGGMERVAASQMQSLTELGWNFNIVSQRPWGPGRQLFMSLDPEAEDNRIAGRFGWRSHRDLVGSLRRRSAECDVTWVIGTSLGSVRAARRIRRPVVLSHHYHHLERGSDALKWRLFYEACRGVQRVTFPTEFTRAEAVRIAPWLADRTHVIPTGVEIMYTTETSRHENQQRAREALGIREDAFVVGNAGWLIPRKRFDIFLRTAAQLSRHLPNSHFEICGAGPLQDELQALTTSLGIANRVVFRGLLHNMELSYRAWDACLFNSDYDTLPTTPLEAASYGCVVIASLKYGGLGEFLRNGDNGVLLRDHDVSVLCDAIRQVEADKALATSWRKAARRTLEHEFSLTRSAQTLSSILQP